ncbi:MAG: DUF418 domain-containing protein [Haloferacaceae archaeon]
MTPDPEPTPPSERIVSLDALRGFALLGILVINVRVFAMPEVTLLNPSAYGDFSGANYWIWFLGHVFAEKKFITLFSALFGAGVVLFTRSKERKGLPARRLHLRRMGWLVAIGLAHAYLLWYGDILVAYGLCGIVFVVARDWEPTRQATFGLAVLAVPSVTELLLAVSADPAAIAAQWSPAASTISAEVAAYRGGWIAQMDHRVPTSFARQTTGFVSSTGWRVGGTMLLGMALFEWGVLTNERPERFYRRLAVGGGLVGLVTVLAGVWYIEANDWAAAAALPWRQFNYWGSFPLAGAYVGLVMLYCRRRADGPVTRAFAAVGRTAFTNYLLQTVVATSVFYGHGLGLFGRVTRVEAFAFVLAVWAVQLPLSVLWLRYFRFGPVEWVWRVLTYRSVQPIRKSS